MMDAIIGRYRVRMGENGLTLGHEAGINFDLTVDEAWKLLHFLNAYEETLEDLLGREENRDTEPALKRVKIVKDERQ